MSTNMQCEKALIVYYGSCFMPSMWHFFLKYILKYSVNMSDKMHQRWGRVWINHLVIACIGYNIHNSRWGTLKLCYIYGIFHWALNIQVTYTVRFPAAVVAQIKALQPYAIIAFYLERSSNSSIFTAVLSDTVYILLLYKCQCISTWNP